MPPKSRPLSRADAAWYRMGSGDNPMVVTALLDFDQRVDVEALRSVMAERVTGPLPRFRQRVSRGLRWEDDPRFRIEHHITREALPGSGDDAALRAFVGDQMSRQLPTDRPLWQLTVIDRADGGSSILARIHHAVADGMALVAVLLSLTDLDAAGTMRTPVPVPPPAELRRFSIASRIRGAARAGLDLVDQARSLVQVVRLGADTAMPFHGELSGAKRAAWSDAIDLADIKAFRKDGYSINDVVVAAASGAIRRWMLDHGHDPAAQTMRATVPMNLRPLERSLELGNEFGLLFLELPIDVADPAERLRASKQAMDELKRSSEAGAALNSLRMLGTMPAVGQRLVSDFFASKASAVMSNVPGPPLPLYLDGRELRDVMFWVPQSGPVGLGLSILTYNGKVRMGVASDAAFVADPSEVTRLFGAELHELSRAVLGGAALR